MIACTLFDSNYLDKGIALQYSLERTCTDYKLYILAMDDRCCNILNKLSLKNVFVISLDVFLDDKLRQLKEKRTRAEFCWTCTAKLIGYVLENYNEEICTYVDADVFFYSDPTCLIEEMGEKTVQIVEHRFSDSLEDRLNMRNSGRYCVEFNTFKNDEESLKLLHWWQNQCMQACSEIANAGIFGDQKYLEGWETKDFVSVLKHKGGGVAPWNVFQYTLYKNEDGLMLKDKEQDIFNLVFYHFHMIDYLAPNYVKIHVYNRCWRCDDSLIREIYIPYLQELDAIKNMLKRKFDFYPLLLHHPAHENRKKKNILQLIRNLNRDTLLKIVCFPISWLKGKVRNKRDYISF